MKHRIAVALSVLAILVATLHSGGGSLPHGWSFTLTSGEAALAELIQNLLLFIPLGAALTLAGVRPLRAIAIGAALSFTVEFVQQWIPGRDPSVGDIVCNTVSTGLGVLLVATAPRWLTTPPRRSGWQALAAAVVAVLVWLATGALLHPSLPPGPYHELRAPRFNYWGHYEGTILWTSFVQGTLSVQAVWPVRLAGRSSPLVALLDTLDKRAIILAVDGADLALRYHMPAVDFRLEQPDLRWRGALAKIAPGDTFLAGTKHNSEETCLGVIDQERCGLGYTIGDGWKLIFYPERFPTWALTVLNGLWIAGWMVGVGWWAARGGEGRRRAAWFAVGISLLGLIVVPLVTGLKGTTLWEWIGALLGIEGGLILGNRALKGRITST